jgi:hypothetical protein
LPETARAILKQALLNMIGNCLNHALVAPTADQESIRQSNVF